MTWQEDVLTRNNQLIAERSKIIRDIWKAIVILAWRMVCMDGKKKTVYESSLMRITIELK